MEIAQRNNWCRLCHNAALKDGEFYCQLTNNPPDFDKECADFAPSMRYLGLYRGEVESKLLSVPDSPQYLDSGSYKKLDISQFNFHLDKEFLILPNGNKIEWDQIWEVKLVRIDPGQYYIYELNILTLDGKTHKNKLSERDEDEKKCQALLGGILRILEARNKIFNHELPILSDRYAYCEVCNHSEFTKTGYHCGLTKALPKFEGTCPDFVKSSEKVKSLEKNYIQRDYPVRFADAEAFQEDDKLPSELIQRDLEKVSVSDFHDEKAEGRIFIAIAVFAGVVELILDYLFPFTWFSIIVFTIMAFFLVAMVSSDKLIYAPAIILCTIVVSLTFYEEAYPSFSGSWYNLGKLTVQISALFLILKGMFQASFGNTRKIIKYCVINDSGITFFNDAGEYDLESALKWEDVWESHIIMKGGSYYLLLEKLGEVDPVEIKIRDMEFLKPGHLIHLIREKVHSVEG